LVENPPPLNLQEIHDERFIKMSIFLILLQIYFLEYLLKS